MSTDTNFLQNPDFLESADVLATNDTKDRAKYELNIEGKIYHWAHPTITAEQIATLGGWDPAQGVIMIDRDNRERNLAAGEVVELMPGIGFGKRIRWKRG